MSTGTDTTPFSLIYDSFLSKITDDMYMEFNELDTYRLLYELLKSAIYKFEFPRKNIFDYEEELAVDGGTYQGIESDGEEVNLYFIEGGCFMYLLIWKK